jgi:predicted CxxxxCH...CXXCH cytochrome family protein
VRPRSLLVLVGSAAAIVAACETARDDVAPTTYTEHVKPLFEARCLRCHADPAPAAGWSVSSYLEAIGCTADARPVAVGSGAPLLSVFDRPDHAGLLATEERALLASWIASGTPRSAGGVHPRSFADPRSLESHGRFLRARRYAPMTNALDADACGVCHDGAPARPMGIAHAAPGAPSCTSCHDEPTGPLACSTCHGDRERSYPPRDRCFFPGDPNDHAHAAHAGASSSRAVGLPCSTCHPSPATGDLAGVHANGFVDVWFDFTTAGRDARFEPSTKRCSGTCHARGGARPAPTWSEPAMGCNDCHSSPPRDHYRGACTSCHREADATGTTLSSPTLHANGRVDLGDGTGRCGSCHGHGDDPWPSTGAHRAHAHPTNARPVSCETCHTTPLSGAKHPEGKGNAGIRLAGLAVRGGRRATFDPTTKTCAGTYCHEGSGGDAPAPRWTDTAALGCSSCHAKPPAPPHVQSTTCGGAACHEGRTTNSELTPAARGAHIDGVVDRAL